MNLEKIIRDLKGISVFENSGKIKNHIKDVCEYPKEGIDAAVYHSNTSREWSSDDSVPGGGAGDWYEREIITNEYMFLEKKFGTYGIVPCYNMRSAGIVNDVKKTLEKNDHKIDYIIKRETVDGPNWGWFNDIVYVVKEG